LPVQNVELLHRFIGGDPVTVERLLHFIADRYGARKMADMDYRELTLTLANTNVHASHLKIARVRRNDKCGR
jgi:hypothetical protein